MKKINKFLGLLLCFFTFLLPSCGQNNPTPSGNNVKSVSVNPNALSLTIEGESKKVLVKITALDSSKPFNKAFEYTLSDESIVSVLCNEKESGKPITISPLKVGSTTLTVTTVESKKTATVSIKVNDKEVPPDPVIPTNEVYLVLGENGLYEGKKGEDFEKPHWIANAIKYEGLVGSELPGKDKISSTIKDVVFDCWMRGEEDVGSPVVYKEMPEEKNVILYASYIKGDNPNPDPDPGPDPGPEPEGGITVYFSNNKFWETVYCYAWEGDGTVRNNDWPGLEMEYVTENGYGEKIYKMYIDAKYNNIIFTNNIEKTVDISLKGVNNNTQYYCVGDSSPYNVETVIFEG